MYVCMYACMHACMYVCMYVCNYVCMYVIMQIMHACMYVCMYLSYPWSRWVLAPQVRLDASAGEFAFKEALQTQSIETKNQRRIGAGEKEEVTESPREQAGERARERERDMGESAAWAGQSPASLCSEPSWSCRRRRWVHEVRPKTGSV